MELRTLNIVRVGALLGIVAIAGYVVINPDLVYRSTPRAVLFMIVACLPAILFASEAVARFDMKLPGFAASAGGGAAIIFIALLLLDHIAKPEQYIGVFHIYDAQDQPMQGLDRPDAVQVLPAQGGLRVTHYVDGHTLIVVFPEQVRQIDVLVRPILAAPAQRVSLRYDGTTERNIKLEAFDL